MASQLGLTGQLGLATASAASDRAGGPASCEMSASGHSAMDTSPARDQQPILDRSSGRMVVAVPGTSIDETPGDIAGWLVATQRGKKATPNNAETPQQVSAPQPGKKAAQPTRAQIIKKVNANFAKTARMPNVPRNECKVIVRPRGGLMVGKIMMPELVQAIAGAARISLEDIQRDTICPNVAQNIIVISTPDGERVSRYATIHALMIGNQTYQVCAYAAAPENTVKGVIGGIPLSETPEMIRAKVVNIYNGTALEAHRIGNSHAVIVLFKGDKVPSYVKYCGALIRCRLYRQHKEVCRTCGQVGHRRDVCPRPNVVVCFACGKANPGENHEQECKPRCKLCGGSHPTGTGNCANKFKTPFLLRKREHERKMAAEKAGKSDQSKVRFSRKDEFPELSPSKQGGRRKSRSESRGRTQSRGRSESRDRRRSPSRDGRKSWTDIAGGGAKGGKGAKERQRSRTPARKPQNDPLASKIMQLESTIRLLQETVKQQQETMKQQKELIARFTSQQHGNQSGTPWSVGTAQQAASFTPLGTPVMPPPPPPPQSLGQGKTPSQKKVRRSSVIESDEDEDLNMNNGDDETESISSISTLHSRNTDTQGGLNCGARFKKITARLNRQDKRINEISQKVDNVASAMKKLENDVKAEFAQFEARVEARINTGFEEMKHFMVQLLKEELGKLGHGNRTSPGASPSHG